MLFLLLALLQAARAGIDVNVDPDPLPPPQPAQQNEISLAIVPGTAGSPQLLVAAYNDNAFPGGYGLGVSYSTNGGATWTGQQLPNPTPALPPGPILPGTTFNWSFDPTAAADTQGNVFVAHIAVNNSIGSDNGLYVWRNSVTGLALSQPWQQAVVSEWGASSGFPDYSYRFNDRDQITVDRFPSPQSSYTDRVYIAWIKDRGYFNQATAPASGLPESDIYFAYSTDNGATFTELTTTLNNTTGQPMGNMPIPRVAANGDVYVSWLNYNVWDRYTAATPSGGQGTIYLTKSTDGGASFTQVGAVGTISLPFQTQTIAASANPFSVSDAGGNLTLAKGAPVLATSPLNSSELYMAYAADPDRIYNPDGTIQSDPADESDIFFIRSTDGGVNWSTPLALNTDTTQSDQIQPWIDVKPNGTIDVAWYDRRNDPTGDAWWDIYVTSSADGGLTFLPEVQLNDAGTSFLSPSGWLGEYLGLAVDSGYGYAAWTSAITDLAGGDIYFDSFLNPQQAAIPEPSSTVFLVTGVAFLLLIGVRKRRGKAAG